MFIACDDNYDWRQQKMQNICKLACFQISEFVSYWKVRWAFYGNDAVSILWQWCRFVFLFIGRELTTWPANNCLQIMVCSCSVSSNCVWLQIILCSCINETALFCFFASLLLENGRSLCFSKKFIKKHKLSDQTIKKIIELQLSQNILIYQCVSQINCLPKLKAHHWQIMIFWSTPSKNKLLDIFISFQSVDC